MEQLKKHYLLEVKNFKGRNKLVFVQELFSTQMVNCNFFHLTLKFVILLPI